MFSGDVVLPYEVILHPSSQNTKYKNKKCYRSYMKYIHTCIHTNIYNREKLETIYNTLKTKGKKYSAK